MPRTLTLPITLYTSQAALTLELQPIDEDGAAVGDAITTGFAPASGASSRLWTGTIPDGAVGYAVLDASDDSEIYRDALPGAQVGELPDVSGLSTFDAATDEVIVSALPDPAPAGYGGADVTLYGEDGAISWQYTCFKPDGTTPLSGCVVYVSSDSAGTLRSQTKVTDGLGRVTFHLNAGTVYVWRRHARYSFSDPDIETVSA